MSYTLTRSPSAATGGSGLLQWTGPTAIFTSNNSPADTLGYAQYDNISQPLIASGFGFALPAGVLIQGISVSIEKRAAFQNTTDYSKDSSLLLVKNGVASGTNKADVVTKWPTTDTIVVYGGASDTWGQTWTAEDVNSSNFGVEFKANTYNEVTQRYSYVDHIQVTVTYDYVLPDAPTGLTRSNFDKTDAAVFSWTFSDPNPGDTQSAYQLLIYDADDNSLDHDSGKVTSATSSMTLTANALANEKQYQWKVRVYDSSDRVSDYSTLASFYTSAKPVVVITSPAADHDDLAVASIAVTWTCADQTAYRAVLFDANDVQLESSGKITGTEKTYTFSTVAVNGAAYYAEVTAYDDKDIAGVTVRRYFEAAFTAPPTPTIVVTTDSARGKVTIVITNPAPGGGQPAFSYNSVYRKKSTESVYTRIATGIAEDATFVDYTPESGVAYNYFVRSVGTTTGYADSIVSNQSITLTGPQLANTADYTQYIYLSAAARAKSKDYERKLMRFAGRSAAVAEFGEHAGAGLSIAAVTLTDAAMASLEALFDANEILLYRDERGRKEFVTSNGIDQTDEMPTGYRVKFSFDRTSYTEAV